MDIIGRIRFQHRVFVDRQECYGAVRVDDNKFKILIAKCAGKTSDVFAETLLHEFIHLWLFIFVTITNIRVSERKHHRIIDKIMPVALRELRRYQKK